MGFLGIRNKKILTLGHRNRVIHALGNRAPHFAFSSRTVPGNNVISHNLNNSDVPYLPMGLNKKPETTRKNTIEKSIKTHESKSSKYA